MGRKIFELIGSLLIIYCSPVFALQPVFDATNAEKFVTMINQARTQVNELQGMSNKLQNTNYILGINNPRLLEFTNQANTFGNYLYNLGSLNSDPLSLLNLLGYNRLGHNNYRDLIEMSDFIKDKLYPSSNSVVSQQQ